MAMDNRREFFREFFPKWSGFCVNSLGVNIQPVEALQRLQSLFEGITGVCTCDTTRISRWREVEYSKLKIWEVSITINWHIYIGNGTNSNPNPNPSSKNLKILTASSNIVDYTVYTKIM